MSDLPNDIVFQLIQSHLGSHSLDTLRHLSQISRTWRALALSPTLWAEALDFEDLRLKKDIWRTEVLRRTGNCALHVNGSWIPSVTQEFFLHEFLVPNLHRIKTLHAHIGLMNNKVAQDPAWSVIFDQPAPMLEIFSMDFDARHKQDPPRAIQHALRDGKALFTGNAPALHTFNNKLYLALNPGTQPAPDWMVNLTTIMVSEHPKTVLGILTRTPRLRRLFLMKTVSQEIEGLPGVSSVELPCLKYIYKDYTYPYDYFVDIQRAIKAPPGMSVFAHFETPGYIDAAAILFRKYIDETQPKMLHFRLPMFWLGDSPLTSRPADVDDMFLDSSRKDFAIVIGGKFLHPSDFLRRVLADGVDFSSVQEWHIRRRGYSSSGGCSERMVAALKEFFAKVLKPDVTLTVDENNYKYFRYDAILPKGHTFELVKNGPEDNKGHGWDYGMY